MSRLRDGSERGEQTSSPRPRRGEFADQIGQRLDREHVARIRATSEEREGPQSQVALWLNGRTLDDRDIDRGNKLTKQPRDYRDHHDDDEADRRR